jgi:hypothetical protein
MSSCEILIKENRHSINQKLYDLNIKVHLLLIVGVKCMYDLTQKQSQLSLAYIHAVASYAGCTWKPGPVVDIYKIDGTIIGEVDYVKGEIKDTIPELRVQVKSTRQAAHQPKAGDPYIHYPLDRETYDKLRDPHHNLILLVLFVLPVDDNEWVNHTEDELITRKCAYWHSIKDCPDGSLTIKISRDHVFSPEQLVDLMNKVARKERIPNGCD